MVEGEKGDLTNLNPKEPDSVDRLNNYLAFVLFHLNRNMQNVRLPQSDNYLADPKWHKADEAGNWLVEMEVGGKPWYLDTGPFRRMELDSVSFRNISGKYYRGSRWSEFGEGKDRLWRIAE